MKYRIISVGKIREPFYKSGVEEYLKRLRPYTNVELIDGLEEKVAPRAGEADINRILNKEAQKIEDLIGQDEVLVLLDLKGQMNSSEKFAVLLEDWNRSGKNRVNFIIGGSHGLDKAFKKKADLILSFSQFTFPHQMAVLILTEQIYRGFKIIKGEPYHK